MLLLNSTAFYRDVLSFLASTDKNGDKIITANISNKKVNSITSYSLQNDHTVVHEFLYRYLVKSPKLFSLT